MPTSLEGAITSRGPRVRVPAIRDGLPLTRTKKKLVACFGGVRRENWANRCQRRRGVRYFLCADAVDVGRRFGGKITRESERRGTCGVSECLRPTALVRAGAGLVMAYVT